MLFLTQCPAPKSLRYTPKSLWVPLYCEGLSISTKKQQNVFVPQNLPRVMLIYIAAYLYSTWELHFQYM